MFNNSNGYSLGDIAAATGGNNRNDGMWDNGAWWIIILFLFCFNGGMWGNGFGRGMGGQGAGTRAILDYLCQEKISDLQSENQALRLAASQQAQNNYLVSQLGTKAPVPAYVVANPYCNCGTAAYGCGLTA